MSPALMGQLQSLPDPTAQSAEGSDLPVTWTVALFFFFFFESIKYLSTSATSANKKTSILNTSLQLSMATAGTLPVMEDSAQVLGRPWETAVTVGPPQDDTDTGVHLRN